MGDRAGIQYLAGVLRVKARAALSAAEAPANLRPSVMMAPVFLGLGSNLGDRERALDEGLRLLEARGFRVERRSSLWLTAPVGGPPQGDFLNAVVQGATALSPEELLGTCLDTERDLGRVRLLKNGPRTLDVDILFYGDEKRDEPGLVIPHPRLQDRLFVLAPLAEIAPDFRHPVLGRTVAELRERCPDPSPVRVHAAPRARVG
jgi:2-amino-4-hydroxy-6-hydroxymethyldihydropteridine diphosphokinase